MTISAATGRVDPRRRYTPAHPCPICGGHGSSARGTGERCTGYLDRQGKGAFCSNVESSHPAKGAADTLWWHPMPKANGHAPGTRPTPATRPKAKATTEPPLGWLARYCSVSADAIDALREIGAIDADDDRVLFTFRGRDAVKRRIAGTKDFDWIGTDAPPPLWPLTDEYPATLVLTESETDAIVLRSHGIEAYALTKGAKGVLTPPQIDALRGRGVEAISVAFDADDDGREGVSRQVASIIASDLRVTTLCPPDYDPITGSGKDWREWHLAGGQRLPEPETGAEVVRTVKDILATPPTRWRHVGYEAIGALHMLYGRPKSGKSTAEYARAAAYERGEAIFGANVKGITTTFFLTEEDPETVREKVERFDLRRAEFLTFTDAKERGFSFAEALAFAVQQCRKRKHGRLVIDTLTTWAEVRDLNDSKEMADAINAIRSAANGITKVLLYHANKRGGEYGDAILGATGIFASIDVGIEWERDEGRRNLRVTTRFRDAPEDVAVELVEDQFVVAGTPRIRKVKRSATESKDLVLDRLRAGPVTVKQMVAEGTADLSDFQIAKYCRELEAEGKAVSTIADKQSKAKAYVAARQVAVGKSPLATK